MNRPMTESDVAVYGMIRNSSLYFSLFLSMNTRYRVTTHKRINTQTYILIYKIDCKYFYILNYIIPAAKRRINNPQNK